jgi:hypothetical protein
VMTGGLHLSSGERSEGGNGSDRLVGAAVGPDRLLGPFPFLFFSSFFYSFLFSFFFCIFCILTPFQVKPKWKVF